MDIIPKKSHDKTHAHAKVSFLPKCRWQSESSSWAAATQRSDKPTPLAVLVEFGRCSCWAVLHLFTLVVCSEAYSRRSWPLWTKLFAVCINKLIFWHFVDVLPTWSRQTPSGPHFLFITGRWWSLLTIPCCYDETPISSIFKKLRRILGPETFQ